MKIKNILFVDGIPDDQLVEVLKVHTSGKFKWKGKGSANLADSLSDERMKSFKIVFDTKGDQELPGMKVHAVFNQISDPDSHKVALKKADDFYRAVKKHLPFYNPPQKVMQTSRDKIYELLQGIDGLHVPKTIKLQPMSPEDIYATIEKEGFAYPVIFRQAGDHGGISTLRVDDETEKFFEFALDGRDYYITQFVDASTEGMYAKYRLVVVDGEVFIRHVIFGKEWMVHAGSQLNDEKSSSIKEDVAKRFTKEIKPNIEPVITQIYNRLGLDYFGIDCNIDKNMNILIFEVNPNMNVFAQSEGSVFSEHIEEIREALKKMLTKG